MKNLIDPHHIQMPKESFSNRTLRTSSGELISSDEFSRRKSIPGYCVDCGAKITITGPLVDRCGICSSDYYEKWLESSQEIPGSGGLFGAE